MSQLQSDLIRIPNDRCAPAMPGITYRAPLYSEPSAYDTPHLQPSNGEYIVLPRAYNLGITSPYVNDIRRQSGFECCTTLADNCKCSPKEYTPGYRLPGVYSGYESSCPCYPITFPGPDYGAVNYMPWEVPFVTQNAIRGVVNPPLTNIQPP